MNFLSPASFLKLFFIFMMVLPASWQFERALFLFFICSWAAINIRNIKLRYCREILIISIICLALSLFQIVVGLINNNPGAVRVSGVFFFWPLAYLLFVGLFNKIEDLKPFLNLIIFGLFGVEILTIIFISDFLGVSSLGTLRIFEQMNPSINIGIYEGESGLFHSGLTTLNFSLPFLITKIIIDVRRNEYRKIDISIALIGVLIALLSGRRALWIILSLSPFFYIVINSYVTKKIDILFILKVFMMGFLLFITLVYFLQLDVSLLLDRLVAGFDFGDSTNESAFRRNEQYHALLNGWLDSPIIGSGHGAAAQDNINLAEMQWAYELSYLALLFHVGIIGFFIYFASIIWMIIMLSYYAKEYQNYSYLVLPLLVGLVCFLIANASNPYLLKFDYLWVIFLPLAFLNAFCLKSSILKYEI